MGDAGNPCDCRGSLSASPARPRAVGEPMRSTLRGATESVPSCGGWMRCCGVVKSMDMARSKFAAKTPKDQGFSVFLDRCRPPGSGALGLLEVLGPRPRNCPRGAPATVPAEPPQLPPRSSCNCPRSDPNTDFPVGIGGGESTVNGGTCTMLSYPHGRDLSSAEPQAAPARAREEARNALSGHGGEGALRRPRQVAAGRFRWRSYGGAARGVSPPLLSESTRLGAEPDVEVRIVRAFSVDPGRQEALRLRRERMHRHGIRGTHRSLAGLRHLRCQRPGAREWWVLQVRRECMDRPDVSARR